MNSSKASPQNNLLQVTAQLIKHRILDIKKIIPHLTPHLKETEEHFAKNISETQNAYNTINARIAKDLSFTSGNYLLLSQQSSNSANAQAIENPPVAAIPNYFVNFNEYVNEYLNSANTNQFYQLLKSLVKVRDWESCDFIHGLLESSFDPLGSSELVEEISKALRQMIAPLYKKAGLQPRLKIMKKTIALEVKNGQEAADGEAKVISSNDPEEFYCKASRKKPFEFESLNNINCIVIDQENRNQINGTATSDSISGAKVKKAFNSEAAAKGDCAEDSFNSAEDFIMRLPKILKFLTLGLGFDQILFQKILKLIKHFSSVYIKTASKSVSSTNVNNTINKLNNNIIINNDFQNTITDLICKVFLPAISISEPTPTLLNCLWDVINLFDYSKRYKIYSYWMNYLYNTHPVLYLRSRIIVRETSKWQNTFSKENQKSHGRILGILTKSNPVIIFDKIIKPLTSYDNQIDIIIKALGYGSSLNYDVISYVIGKTLTDSSKEKLDMNFGDVHNWFKNFCYFVGCFYKEYQNVDFSFIFHYLVTQLKSKNQNCYIEFLIVKEIIEKMSMVFTQETMDESQIQSSFGGICLYLEAMDIVKEYKNLNKPIQHLLKFFLGDVLGSEKDKAKIVSKISAAINGFAKGNNGHSRSKERNNGNFFYTN